MAGYIAKSKFILVSPHKIRPVADLIRGKLYTDAVTLLSNMPHKGAKLIGKTLKSAGANALTRNKQLDESMLFVKTIMVDDGPRMKRIWYRARGRADMLLKRMSHITVIVDEIGRS
ncbi:MAG: 50S ribosomal protein L22 [Spirochaetaceae bacterium]|jgi:large subunit ribosomal protein L22|nr:50S ribosomal protein L22 [Spirochaetaceae bacterium]